MLLALARAFLRAGLAQVEDVRAGPRALILTWVPDRRTGLERGSAWVFLLNPRPEFWLLSEKDEAFRILRSESHPDLSRRWSLELKGARLVDLEGDPRERWLGLEFHRRAITGRSEKARLAFQAIPGRAGLRLDGLEGSSARLGMGSPFPAGAPECGPEPPPLLRWRAAWGPRLNEALAGELADVLPGMGDLRQRHRAWSLERAQVLLVDPRQAKADRRLQAERQRLERYGAALARDRDRHRAALGLRAQAQALSDELWQLKGSSGQVRLQDGRLIELPAGWSAQEAVQRWFQAVKKAERGMARIAVLEDERLRQLADLEGATAAPPPLPRPALPKASSKKEGRMEAARRKDGKGRAFRTVTVEGFEVVIGKGDADNDQLTFKVAAPADFWLHVAGVPGSHVVIRNPDKLGEIPREVLERAAQLAAFHSKAREGGKVEVHWCRVADVSKPRGFAPGKVMLRSYKALRVYPKE
jgi:NFACT protein RNA binding domain